MCTEKAVTTMVTAVLLKALSARVGQAEVD